MKIRLVLTLLFAVSFVSFANKKSEKGYSKKPFERKVFIENKGQFDLFLPLEYRKFQFCIDNGSRILFSNNELIYHFTKDYLNEFIEEEKQETERGRSKSLKEEERERKKFAPDQQFIKLKWLNANPNAKIEVSKKNNVDYGYIVGFEKKHTLNCNGYEKLIIRDLYPGIDAEYFFPKEGGKVKYNLVCSQNADISRVKFRYEGSTVELFDGNIVVKTIVGNLIEYAPVSFSVKDNRILVSSFVKENNAFRLNVEESSSSIIIDPLLAVPGLGGQDPVDNGVDKYGNHYVTSKSYVLEKYDPTGVLQFSKTVFTGSGWGSFSIYGDMLTNSVGSCFYNTVWGQDGKADATAVDSAGNWLWDSFGITECWRFVQNECTGQVFSLTGYRHSETGFATISAVDGSLTNYTQSGKCCQDPHCGALDSNGDIYTVASDGGNTQIYKWDIGNNLVGTYPSPGPFGYGSGYAGMQGYNGMTMLGDFLFINNGATVYKVNKNNGAAIAQTPVPNGIKSKCGGTYITACGYLVIGSTDGAYLYDTDLNKLDFRATDGPCYDITINKANNTFAICGPGHVSEVSFNIPNCIFSTNPTIVPSCNGGANGSIKLNLRGGVPNYKYTWSGNGVSGTTDSIVGLLPGTYKVVYSDNKCPIPTVDSTEVIVPIQTVKARFETDSVCFGSPTSFTNKSTTTVGSFTGSNWDFGNTQNSLLANPKHTYSLDGTFKAKLIVTATHGCKDSVIDQNVIVLSDPIAQFSFSTECNTDPVQFTSTSSINTGIIKTWNWNFGDGTASSLENPIHTFPTDRYPFLTTRNVRLSVSTNKGCTDDTVMSYRPHPMPLAVFSAPNSCENTPISFTNLSKVVDPDVIGTTVFDFNDGTPIVTSTGNPIHTFAAEGDYNVSIIVNTTNGCVKDTSITITAYPEPDTDFSFTEICENQPPTLFTNNTTIKSGSIETNNWQFGDGNSSVLENPTNFYQSAETYNVTLTSFSNFNCQKSNAKSVTVKAKPLAKFQANPPEGCNELCVQFTSTSVSNSGSNLNYQWSFSNNKNSTAANPSICFKNPSNTKDISYDVKLITTNDLSCSDTLSLIDYIKVYHKPVAKFTSNKNKDTKFDESVEFRFKNESIGANDYILNFGDGSQSEGFDPIHNYSDTGVYHIILTSITTHNCLDSAHSEVKVVPMVSMYIPNTFSPNEDDKNDIFNAISQGIVEKGFELRIFDRWGAEIFFTSDIDEGWNGTHNGTDAQIDTYLYKLKCVDYFGEPHEYAGHINLIR